MANVRNRNGDIITNLATLLQILRNRSGCIIIYSTVMSSQYANVRNRSGCIITNSTFRNERCARKRLCMFNSCTFKYMQERGSFSLSVKTFIQDPDGWHTHARTHAHTRTHTHTHTYIHTLCPATSHSVNISSDVSKCVTHKILYNFKRPT